MFITISGKHLRELERIMATFLDEFRAALEKVVSTQNDAAAIQALKDKIVSIEALNAEQSTALLELAQKLGEAPITPES